MDIQTQITVVFTAFALGAVLKGATGVGTGVIAVPALAIMFDVRFAIVVMLVPNLLTNLWQLWHFRRERLPPPFAVHFAIAGAVGAIGGTYILTALPSRMLLLFVMFGIFIYLALRLARPGTLLSMSRANQFSVPAGIAAGVLQGTSGLSTPVSVGFLNAMGLARAHFIFTISLFFTAVACAQLSALAYSGILSAYGLAMSVFAMLPVLIFMPVGSFLARRFSQRTFDRAILSLLSLLALRLIHDFWTGA